MIIAMMGACSSSSGSHQSLYFASTLQLILVLAMMPYFNPCSVLRMPGRCQACTECIYCCTYLSPCHDLNCGAAAYVECDVVVQPC